jgi:hypothetical protein
LVFVFINNLKTLKDFTNSESQLKFIFSMNEERNQTRKNSFYANQRGLNTFNEEEIHDSNDSSIDIINIYDDNNNITKGSSSIKKNKKL